MPPQEDIVMMQSSTRSSDEYTAAVDLDKLDTILEPYLEGNKATMLHTPNHRTLGCISIIAITYFVGCGGPIGSEPIFAAGGPLIGFLALVIYPIVCTIPYAFVIAELCSAFPEDGGFAIWVTNAFGPFWGIQVGYWSWIAGILNGALLPGLLLSLLLNSNDGWELSWTASYLIKVGIAMALAIPTVLGTRIVARGSILLLAFVLLPVLIFAVWGIIKADNPSRLSDIRRVHEDSINLTSPAFTGPVKVDWSLLINSLFWNYDGINMASLFGGEVSNPARVYSRAIFSTVLLTVLTYIVPAPAAIMTAFPHWSKYEEGSYPDVAFSIGGLGLQNLLVFSSICTTVGLYISSLFTQCCQICGMAENKLLPSVLARRNAAFDTPHCAVIVSVMCTIVLVGVDFEVLLSITNGFSGAVSVAIILTGMHLRRKLPFIPRPTRVPGGVRTMGCLCIIPAAVLSYIVVEAFQDLFRVLLVVLCLAPGIVYGVVQARRQRKSAMTPTEMFI